LVAEGTPDSKSKPPPTVKDDSDDVIYHGRGLLGISGFPVTGKPGRIAKTRQRGFKNHASAMQNQIPNIFKIPQNIFQIKPTLINTYFN
jgi:hypothetical protein